MYTITVRIKKKKIWWGSQALRKYVEKFWVWSR